MAGRRNAYWTCGRQSGGEKCGQRNSNRKQKCEACGKQKPARKLGHKEALRLTYEEFIVLNGGEHCGICGKVPKEGDRRLDRDHDHHTGEPRGLLCFRCNKFLLHSWVTPEILENAVAYLRR